MPKMPESLHGMSIGKIATIVGIVTGLIAILTFGGDVYSRIANHFVSTDELKASEQRIIQKIEDEAILTRTAIIEGLIERKAKLSERLSRTEHEGQAAALVKEIEDLDKKIDRLRGGAQ